MWTTRKGIERLFDLPIRKEDSDLRWAIPSLTHKAPQLSSALLYTGSTPYDMGLSHACPYPI